MKTYIKLLSLISITLSLFSTQLNAAYVFQAARSAYGPQSDRMVAQHNERAFSNRCNDASECPAGSECDSFGQCTLKWGTINPS